MNESNLRPFMHIARVFCLAVVLLSGFSCRDDDPYQMPEKSLEILKLKIDTKNFAESRIFWTENLGFEEVSSTASEFTVRVGSSLLTFKAFPFIPQFPRSPQYHFSLNIPSNQAENALEWLKNEGNKYSDGPSNPVEIWESEFTGAEIIRRDRYNAHSVFFKDPGGNVIELIARHNLNNQQEGIFNHSMILNISGVAIVTRDVKESAKRIRNTFDVIEVPGTTSGFKPLGSENGLIVLVVPGRSWEPTDSQSAESWPMEITVRHPQPLEIQIPGTNFESIVILTAP